jgi:hypothetical protein
VFHILEPEVAGGWGPGTDADTTVHPPVVRRLVYEFEGWLGDDLLETFPCFVVTDRLAQAIRTSGLTGFELGPVEVVKSEIFEELQAGGDLPDFHRLFVLGDAEKDDFSIDSQRLRLSDAALAVLGRFAMEHCDVRATT